MSKLVVNNCKKRYFVAVHYKWKTAVTVNIVFGNRMSLFVFDYSIIQWLSGSSIEKEAWEFVTPIKNRR